MGIVMGEIPEGNIAEMRQVQQMERRRTRREEIYGMDISGEAKLDTEDGWYWSGIDLGW